MLVDFDCAELTEAFASNAAIETITKKGFETLEVTYRFNILIKPPKKNGKSTKGKEFCAVLYRQHTEGSIYARKRRNYSRSVNWILSTPYSRLIQTSVGY